MNPSSNYYIIFEPMYTQKQVWMRIGRLPEWGGRAVTGLVPSEKRVRDQTAYS